ncbi:pseudaminic acid biosynthesis-associated methylase [Cohnella silvisoli]|uniref:Methyltransferase domain-containing protein n=1 Tax=Cohnella silvisoli TaxID=2873699 RepID=A0ABV1KPJ3_9BACL|nr:pseudaminic acid biosynthesis-associated methylase [Cohnella silvisoli]MCD9022312.1 methyltransferase domain-containing protein [Cohnella silvisoli]
MKTSQMDFWNGEFGAAYTDRNSLTFDEMEDYYKSNFEVTRTEMNREFLSNVQLNSALEVGCNVGCQLEVLQRMGYENLYGIELQWYAVEKTKEKLKRVNVVQGSAFQMPFKDGCFDLVFTNGVLIHIAPDDIGMALDEIYRVSDQYIWGCEYFSENYQELNYHGVGEKMWKTNFMKLYLDRFPDLSVVREKKYTYTSSQNQDQMFLLKKNK